MRDRRVVRDRCAIRACIESRAAADNSAGATAAAAAALGIRKHWPDVVNTSVTFFIVFMYTKFYDWWWDLMPKYLFFLVLGLTALLTLFVLRRLRSEGATAPQTQVSA